MEPQTPITPTETVPVSKKSALHQPINFIYALFVVTIIAAGATAYIFHQATQLSEDEARWQMEMKAPVKEQLPTEFRSPTPEGAPHIVGAEIETIAIPDNHGKSNIEIISHMEGISDATIIKINDNLSQRVFRDQEDNIRDVRESKNQFVGKGISFGNFQSHITYVDKDIIGYNVSGSIFYDDQPRASYFNNENDFIVLAKDGSIDPAYDESNDIFFSSDPILSHFYPNGEALLDKMFLNDGEDISGDECYSKGDFPGEFIGMLDPSTKEVVYKMTFGWANAGPCDNSFDNGPGAVRIAIPIADILKQVPQFVPKDSILWKFQ